MCGGGSPRSVINMPNTGAYDQMAQAQFDAMKLAQDGTVALKQMQLNQTLTQQQETLSNLRDVRVQRANDTAANASRMAALLGPPPPEKAATAPTVGSNRSTMTRPSGKRGMRIDRTTTASSSAGTGLNITY
jgi:hypothetical protein